jgi:hypothetical protein
MILANYIHNHHYTENLKSEYEIYNNLQTPNLNTYNINYAYLLEQNLHDNDNIPYHDSIVAGSLIIFFIFGKYLLNIYA